MKLATWNVNSIRVRLPQLLDWLAAAQPDVLCLQELKCEEPKFPRAEIEAAGLVFERTFDHLPHQYALVFRKASR